MTDNDVFCRILRGEADASFVYQDEAVAAFLDAYPFTTGHLLVVPRTHAANLADLDEATGGRLFVVAMRLAAALRRSVGCSGVNLYLADGRAAWQHVMHVHLHVIPRSAGDGVGPWAHQSRRRPGQAELEGVAGRIREGLR